MKKALLIAAAVGCGVVGAFLYLAALLFRVNPPELAETQFMDVIIGLFLGGAAWAAFHAIELPHAPPERTKLSLATGVLVCVCAAASLVACHRLQLAERERQAQAAISAAAVNTNAPISRPLEQAH
jgi:H+/Cl- antiporter ClcA